MKTELKNSTWFVLSLLLRQKVKKLCIISVCTEDYELKLSTETNLDTLISNLKLDLIIFLRDNDIIYHEHAKSGQPF